MGQVEAEYAEQPRRAPRKGHSKLTADCGLSLARPRALAHVAGPGQRVDKQGWQGSGSVC